MIKKGDLVKLADDGKWKDSIHFQTNMDQHKAYQVVETSSNVGILWLEGKQGRFAVWASDMKIFTLSETEILTEYSID